MEITSHIPINPTTNDMKYFKEITDFNICRSSKIVTIKHDLGERSMFSIGYRQDIVLDQTVSFNVAYYFQEQGRYLIKEFKCKHIVREGPNNNRNNN